MGSLPKLKIYLFNILQQVNQGRVKLSVFFAGIQRPASWLTPTRAAARTSPTSTSSPSSSSAPSSWSTSSLLSSWTTLTTWLGVIFVSASFSLKHPKSWSVLLLNDKKFYRHFFHQRFLHPGLSPPWGVYHFLGRNRPQWSVRNIISSSHWMTILLSGVKSITQRLWKSWRTLTLPLALVRSARTKWPTRDW